MPTLRRPKVELISCISIKSNDKIQKSENISFNKCELQELKDLVLKALSGKKVTASFNPTKKPLSQIKVARITCFNRESEAGGKHLDTLSFSVYGLSNKEIYDCIIKQAELN